MSVDPGGRYQGGYTGGYNNHDQFGGVQGHSNYQDDNFYGHNNGNNRPPPPQQQQQQNQIQAPPSTWGPAQHQNNGRTTPMGNYPSPATLPDRSDSMREQRPPMQDNPDDNRSFLSDNGAYGYGSNNPNRGNQDFNQQFQQMNMGGNSQGMQPPGPRRPPPDNWHSRFNAPGSDLGRSQTTSPTGGHPQFHRPLGNQQQHRPPTQGSNATNSGQYEDFVGDFDQPKQFGNDGRSMTMPTRQGGPPQMGGGGPQMGRPRPPFPPNGGLPPGGGGGGEGRGVGGPMMIPGPGAYPRNGPPQGMPLRGPQGQAPQGSFRRPPHMQEGGYRDSDGAVGEVLDLYMNDYRTSGLGQQQQQHHPHDMPHRSATTGNYGGPRQPPLGPNRPSSDDQASNLYRSKSQPALRDGPPPNANHPPMPNRPPFPFSGSSNPPQQFAAEMPGDMPSMENKQLMQWEESGLRSPRPFVNSAEASGYPASSSHDQPPPPPSHQNGGYPPNQYGPMGRVSNDGSDTLPEHPTPIRPGLFQNSANAPGPGHPVPQRQYIQSGISETASISHVSVSGVSQRNSTQVTYSELESLRYEAQKNPQDAAAQLLLAKKLIEASQVLADESGRADAKTAKRNRETYIFDAHKIVKKLTTGSHPHPDAMFFLATCYGDGSLGLEVDHEKAFGYYQSAAKMNHAQSAYRTAVCCEIGAGTRKEALKAMQWYRKAATLGDTAAMYKLGMILFKGLLGQQKTTREAVSWLKRAADQADDENPHAIHQLGLLYETNENGDYIIQDLEYSRQLFIRAAELGYAPSQFKLGNAYAYGLVGCPIDARLSIAWYSRAAAKGDPESELALSGWYLTGAEGVLEQSDTEAYLWARKSAEKGLAKAEYGVGHFTELGIGLGGQGNIDEAKKWYFRAAGQGHPKAQTRLQELQRGGGGGAGKKSGKKK